jgi:hypothetical protein
VLKGGGDLYSSTFITNLNKSRNIAYAGDYERMEDMTNKYPSVVGKTKRKYIAVEMGDKIQGDSGGVTATYEAHF